MMTNYSIETKENFTVLGVGTELKSDYTDYAGINNEKTTFWNDMVNKGIIDKLKSIATNDYLFIVNEAVNNKMMHYVGVMTNETLPEATRQIEFPSSEYLVVEGEAQSEKELSDLLTGRAFGEVLPSNSDISYVGGPNTAVIKENNEDLVYGEMWIPIVKNN